MGWQKNDSWEADIVSSLITVHVINTIHDFIVIDYNWGAVYTQGKLMLQLYSEITLRVRPFLSPNRAPIPSDRCTLPMYVRHDMEPITFHWSRFTLNAQDSA